MQRAIGVKVRDERAHPPGQKVWSGVHLHLEITSQTDATLCGFQRRNNLTVDGICGAKTCAALDAIL